MRCVKLPSRCRLPACRSVAGRLQARGRWIQCPGQDFEATMSWMTSWISAMTALLAGVDGRVTLVAQTTRRDIRSLAIRDACSLPAAISSATETSGRMVLPMPASVAFLTLGSESISASTSSCRPSGAQASSMIRRRPCSLLGKTRGHCASRSSESFFGSAVALALVTKTSCSSSSARSRRPLSGLSLNRIARSRRPDWSHSFR